MRVPSLLAAAALAAFAACASAPAGPWADPQAITWDASLGVDLAAARRLPGGVYVQELREGTGRAASAQSTVRLHYTLFLPDGRSVQSSGATPLETRLDDPNFLIRSAVVCMRPGGERLIVVPPERGYGRRGVAGMVPPNSTIAFRVQLVEVL